MKTRLWLAGIRLEGPYGSQDVDVPADWLVERGKPLRLQITYNGDDLTELVVTRDDAPEHPNYRYQPVEGAPV